MEHPRARAWSALISLTAASFLLNCQGEKAPDVAATEKAPLKLPEQAPAAPPSTVPAAAPQPAEPPASAAAKPAGVREGWSARSLKDELPICVFADLDAREKTLQRKDVKPQKLVAGRELTIGVFGPGCLSDACDERPNLQCWIERESQDTFVVNTRFSSFHKDGAECTSDCMDLDTACWTQEPLKAGKYTIRHGDKTYKLQIPSTVKSPCFGAK